MALGRRGGFEKDKRVRDPLEDIKRTISPTKEVGRERDSSAEVYSHSALFLSPTTLKSGG